ncbi:hypothetical protein ACI77M_03800 [Pseudomonas fildesensis]|uniref:hypothetical protein n=1 Tax=Pseudomonas fildesensis TaxID=1674920 RepID=UPI00387B9253
MDHLPITLEQREFSRYVVRDLEQINTAALALFDRLRTFLGNQRAKEVWGISIESKGDGPLIEFDTPFGPARLVLVPFTDERGVQARYILEKRATDAFGNIFWRDVWSMRIDKNGNVFQGNDTSTSFPAQLHFMAQDEHVGSIALSILYASGAEVR